MGAESKARFVHLDALRAFSAALVVAEHLRSFLFRDYPQLVHPSIFFKFFYFITGMGHQAVMIFFVLSGYFVAGSVFERRHHWSWPSYLIQRLSRLWVVLIPALLLCLLWDNLGISLLSSVYYHSAEAGQLYVSASRIFPLPLDVWTFLGNTLFLQTIFVPCYGDNGPLWSLANEFWYYLLFPLLLLGFGLGKSRSTNRVMYLLLSGLVFIMIPVSITQGFVIWMMGFLAYLLARNIRVSRFLGNYTALILTAGLMLASMALTRTGKIDEPWADLQLGAISSLFVVVLSSLPSPWAAYGNFAGRLSDFSYTLYLVHFPMLAFIVSATLDNRVFEPSLKSLAFFLLLFALSFLYAYMIYFCFEKRTAYFRSMATNLYKKCEKGWLSRIVKYREI